MLISLSFYDASPWRLSERKVGRGEEGGSRIFLTVSIGLDTDVLAIRGMTNMTFQMTFSSKFWGI